MHEKCDPAYAAGIKRAADAAWERLTSGASATEAVITAVMHMESDETAFNAGVGGALTDRGEAELDACVMASDGSVGAVACVRNSRNPILLAEKVRTSTPHVLLVGPAADALETSPVANQALRTSRSLESLARWQEQQRSPGGSGSNTVGAVALADDGTLAAATSTGGIVGQWSGRVGDTPLPGAGTYADARVAVSCTGKGEALIRAVAAKSLAAALEYGVPLEEAVDKTLAAWRAVDGFGGLIAVTVTGLVAVAFDTEEMSYAIRSPRLSEERVARGAAVLVVGAL